MLCQPNFLTCFSPAIFSCFATRWLWLLNQADSKKCCGSRLATCSSNTLKKTTLWNRINGGLCPSGHYTASHEVERTLKGALLANLRYLPSTKKFFSQGSQSMSWHLKLGPPECETHSVVYEEVHGIAEKNIRIKSHWKKILTVHFTPVTVSDARC
jgi:hypothetical protein